MPASLRMRDEIDERLWISRRAAAYVRRMYAHEGATVYEIAPVLARCVIQTDTSVREREGQEENNRTHLITSVEDVSYVGSRRRHRTKSRACLLFFGKPRRTNGRTRLWHPYRTPYHIYTPGTLSSAMALTRVPTRVCPPLIRRVNPTCAGRGMRQRLVKLNTTSATPTFFVHWLLYHIYWDGTRF